MKNQKKKEGIGRRKQRKGSKLMAYARLGPRPLVPPPPFPRNQGGGKLEMGCIYQGRKVWGIKYYRNGKPYHGFSKFIGETKAKRLLKKREGEIAKGELPSICYDQMRFKVWQIPA